mmetsp:Transcript_59319/g.167072  ORF Transcript_59319/g.167072 Transcript_59319/m.167072 type:complete len:280 (+) Transcript_59319:586-1425(+)
MVPWPHHTAEVAAHDETLVVDAEVFQARDLDVGKRHLAAAREPVLRRRARLPCLQGVHVEHDELGEVLPRAQRHQRPLPKLGRGDVVAAEREGINKPDSVRYFVAEHERRGTTEMLRVPSRHMHEVVDANRTKLQQDRVLVLVHVAIPVVRDEVLGVLLLRRDTAGDKIGEPLRVAALREVEVEALARVVQGQDLVVGVVLQDPLLQEAEGPAVLDLLPHLHDGVHRVRGERLLAFFTLLVDHLELHHHRLLQHGGIGDLLLHRDFHLDAHGVLLCPDE